jgi:hypothetical protein
MSKGHEVPLPAAGSERAGSAGATATRWIAASSFTTSTAHQSAKNGTATRATFCSVPW